MVFVGPPLVRRLQAPALVATRIMSAQVLLFSTAVSLVSPPSSHPYFLFSFLSRSHDFATGWDKRVTLPKDACRRDARHSWRVGGCLERQAAFPTITRLHAETSIPPRLGTLMENERREGIQR